MDNEQFTRCVIDGSNTSMFSFSSQVGMGSNEQDLVGDLAMIFDNASSDTGVNADNGSPSNGGITKELLDITDFCLLSRSVRILSILSTKKSTNLSDRSSALECSGSGVLLLPLRRVSTVLNSFF